MSPIFSIIFSRSNGQCQRSKSLKCLVWTCNKLHLVGNSIFRVTYTKQINFLHKHLVFYTMQCTSVSPNHSALTFKAVTKLWQDSVSPWRHSFPNSADRGRCFCLYFAETICAQNFVQMNFETDQTSGTFFKVSVHILMPIINTYLQKGCTSYYMPEI